MDYFQLLELPVSFQVDPKILRKRFFEKSRASHPDHFINGSEADQDTALQSSAELNRAFKTLSSPDLTMQYLLQQKGLLVTDEKFALAPSFLMEVMELNEELSDAETGGQLEMSSAIRDRLDRFHRELYLPVAGVIEGYEEGTTSEADLLQVKEYYFKKKYLDRAIARFHQKL